MTRIPRVLFGALSIMVTLASLTSCDSTPRRIVDEPITVASHDEAGSLHVAVLSVAPWDEVKKTQQPVFEMTAEKALSAAVPITQSYVDRGLSAIAASLGPGFTRSGSSRERTQSAASSSRASDAISIGTDVASDQTRTSTTDSGGATRADSAATSRSSSTATSRAESTLTVESTDASKRREFTEPGDAKDADPGKLKSLADLGVDRATGKPDTFEVDPILRHQVATALFQEVQILSRYVDQAARRAGYNAYLVRLQLTLMPRSHRLPFDAYVNVSFFSNKLDETLTSQYATGLDEATRSSAYAALASSGIASLDRAPVVVPLLVTDNLESTIESRKLEKLRQFALGLSGMVSGIGLQAQVGSLQERFQALQGQQMNSLLTIGRLTDNTIRVRLGAINQGTAGTRMVARTHNVSLLVLTPAGTDRVAIVSKSQFVNPDTAEELRSRSSTGGDDIALARVAAKYPEYCFADASGRASDGLKELFQIAFLGDQKAFNERLTAIAAASAARRDKRTLDITQQALIPDVCSGNPWPELRTGAVSEVHRLRKSAYLWADLISLVPGSRFNHTSFDVMARTPTTAPVNIRPADQTAVLVDDGGRLSVALNRGKELSLDKLEASLVLESCHIKLAPISLETTDTARTLIATFPSPNRLKLPVGCAARAPILQLVGCNPTSLRALPVYSAHYVSPDTAISEARPARLILTSAQIIVSPGSLPRLDTSIEVGDAKSVVLRVFGADVVDIQPNGALRRITGGWEATKDTIASVRLRNVVPGSSVTFELVDESGKSLVSARTLFVARDGTVPRLTSTK